MAACAQTEGEISHDAQPFDAISPSASIRLIGTEPFWGLEIEPTHEAYIARYSSPDNANGTEFRVARFAGNNGIGFSGELDGDLAQVALTPGQCSDGMSDRSYPYTATVAIGDMTLYGCGYTSDEPFRGERAP
ncbi:COG3650 family protein [Qipengyuania sp. ASV99]|uniref:COG3650 family protein n=1 Tax=Qipengyuania sp. ASV99 TaxID=3399681 RepID=UPI003A4C6513